MNADRRHSGFALPLKAALAPAELVNVNKLNKPIQVSNQSPHDHSEESIPRDYSNVDAHKIKDQQPHHENKKSLARVTELLHKSVDGSSLSSPPTSRSTSGINLNRMSSPMSSTESLASLIERQNTCKINHPSHQYQLFNSSRIPFRSAERKKSTHSILNLWNPSHSVAHKRSSSSASTSNAPLVKSPLHNEYGDRKLAPNISNPHYVHSSPSVKESKKVYLEYDPVSKKRVLNNYEIIKEIGRGEHGKVKLAKDIYSEELVAIKIVDRKGRQKIGLKPGSSEEEKVRREIAIMKKITHPNVVQLKEVLDDTNSRKIYLVLEYLEKGEIKWQKSPGVPMLTLPEAMKVFRDVVLGLEYLHYQGIIHRDIKPANLLISFNGAVKISDFGVSFASSLKNGEQDDYDLAKTAGTPAFLAPELCLPITTFDDENVKHPKINYKIDIWALGVTLYCLLFGSFPFWADGGNEFKLFNIICTRELTFPETYPTNFEWTEEDKFEARNLLYKVLDKDPNNRINLKEIKRHPLVLRNLSVEEAREFSENQKSCDRKIQVSNDEVKVAVTGIAGKIKKGLAKALKMAGIGKSYDNSSLSTRSQSESRSFLTVDDPSRGSIVDVGRSLSTSSSHRRINSGDAAATKTTVEGDLFLNKGSAFNSLNHIMNDDKRRNYPYGMPSPGSKYDGGVTTNSSSLSDYTTSNDSSLGRQGSQLVSLPVNASFASLDSVYMDNYAPAYVSTKDSRRPQNAGDFRKQMSNFSLNKSAEKRFDDDIAPHDSPTFDLLGSDSDDADEEDADGSIDYDYEDDGFGFFVRPKPSIDSGDQMSELSVPSDIVNNLLPSITQIEIDAPNEKPNQGFQSQFEPSIPTIRKPFSGPKYSFFENDSDSDEEDVNTTTQSEMEPQYLIDAESDGDESEPDEGQLFFSFGNRGRARNNTITALPFKKPSTEPNATRRNSTSRSPKEPVFRNTMQRVSSPLGINAPHTPISNFNAHLLSQNGGGVNKTDYVNHYKRTLPQLPYHIDEDTSRGRANSITVGMLNHENAGHKSVNSQPT